MLVWHMVAKGSTYLSERAFANYTVQVEMRKVDISIEVNGSRMAATHERQRDTKTAGIVRGGGVRYQEGEDESPFIRQKPQADKAGRQSLPRAE